MEITEWRDLLQSFFSAALAIPSVIFNNLLLPFLQERGGGRGGVALSHHPLSSSPIATLMNNPLCCGSLPDGVEREFWRTGRAISPENIANARYSAPYILTYRRRA